MLDNISEKEIAYILDVSGAEVRKVIDSLMAENLIDPVLTEYEEIGGSNFPMTVEYYTFYGNEGFRDSLLIVATIRPEFLLRLVSLWRKPVNSYIDILRIPA